MTTTPAKRGRPAKPYVTRDGKHINGLRRRTNGRWVIVATGESFREPDERLALLRFRRWQSRHRGNETLVNIPLHPDDVLANPDDADAIEFVLRKELGPGEHRAPSDPSHVLRIPKNADPIELLRAIPETAFYAYVRDDIIRRPQYVAEQTGIEQIGYLSDLKKPQPSPTLSDLWNLFAKKKLSPNWKAKCKLAWDEFCRLVAVDRLRDVTQEMMVEFYEAITDSSDYGVSGQRQRIEAVKSVINWPPKKAKWSEDCKRVYAYCAVLIKPAMSPADPHPIDRDDFHKLLNAADADDYMRAVMLTMLNFVMYAGEAAAVDWEDINFRSGVLDSRRPKTGVVRVGILWSETTDALKRLPQRHGWIFSNDIGGRADYVSIYRRFITLRKAVGLPEVQLSHFRDGGFTHAIEGGASEHTAKIIAGEKTGISERYVRRGPKMVAEACAAIHCHYFE